VLSSQIEGTQSTLEDILQFEVDDKSNDLPKDVEEVVNYVGAMNYGINRLNKLPLFESSAAANQVNRPPTP
jgi:cell filamentation protein, protein adenylyltransferase